MSDPVHLPVLQARDQAVDANGRFAPPVLRTLNNAFALTARAINSIAAILGITDQLSASLTQAQATIAQAQKAATAATTAAQQAKDAAANNAKEQALVNSYIDPASVLSASPTTITIAAHTRHYADGTSVAVNGGTVPATGEADVDYVSYLDAARDGGAVTYQVSTDSPTQAMNVHVVGAVTIPATGDSNGGTGPRKPGFVEP